MRSMLTLDVFGLEVPDASPVFLASLGLHVLAGLTGVVSGALAAFARKRGMPSAWAAPTSPC